MTNDAEKKGLRPARMTIRSAVLISSGLNAWSSEIEDISATGVLVARPDNWRGRIDELFILDMLIGESLDIHVDARLARVTETQLGFAYEMPGGHYQDVCPKCRRALFGLSQGALWREHLNARVDAASTLPAGRTR